MTDEELKEALDNAPVVFGLEAQGHIPTIQAMRAEGKSWREIGDKIGWMAGSAEEAYLRWCERKLTALRSSLSRLEQELRQLAHSAPWCYDSSDQQMEYVDPADVIKAADALKTIASQPTPTVGSTAQSSGSRL